MPILLYIVIGIGVVLLAFLAIVAMQSPVSRVERSALIAAPVEMIFALLNDFHLWGQWSPWEGLDPNMKKTYSGAEKGPGSVCHWLGNKQAGEGQMTQLESEPLKRLVIRLEFIKPFTATNTTTFLLTPASGGTNVSWVMDGRKNFMMKAVCLFMNLDKLVGTDFEKGLAKLNTVAQNQATLAGA